MSGLRRYTPLDRRSRLGRSSASLERRTPLVRGKGPSRPGDKPEAGRSVRRPVSECTPDQRKAAKAMGCIVCGLASTGPLDPAHVIDRSLCPEGADDVLAVVGLCRYHHRLYDEGQLDLLPFLERRARRQLAFAVERFGLLKTLCRVTNARWTEL